MCMKNSTYSLIVVRDVESGAVRVQADARDSQLFFWVSDRFAAKFRIFLIFQKSTHDERHPEMSTALTTLEQVVKIVEPLPIHATFPPEFQHFRSRFKKSMKKFIFGKVKLRNRVSHAASTRFSTQSLPVWTVSILAVACSCRMC